MSDMAWLEEHCSRSSSHAPHTWKPLDASILGDDGWRFCNGMGEAVDQTPMTVEICGKALAHSAHHWEKRWGLERAFPESIWCPGVAPAPTLKDLEAAGIQRGEAFTVVVGNGGAEFGGNIIAASGGASPVDKMHCGTAWPHKPHEHNGPIAPDVEPRHRYWCDGQPEYERPELADSTRHIVTKLLPELAQKVMRDAEHYGGMNHRDLGQRGQFVEINGKVGPLRRALWEGHPTVREPVREMAQDLIGHCLLLIEMIDHGVSLDGS